MGRKPFTLVELFLGITIIIILGSVVLVRTKPMLEYYQFRYGCSKLERELAMSRRLSKIINGDIEVYISQTHNGLICKRTTDEPLNLYRTFDISVSIPYLKIEHKSLSFTFTATGWIRGEKTFLVKCNNKSKKIIVKKS